jgi:DNA polymerase-1
VFVKTEGPATANIMFVGEAPGEQENLTGKPFRGPAGHTFDMLLNQAGIVRQNCLVANVAREKPPGNKITFYYEDAGCTVPKPMMRGFIEYLRKEIIALKPNLVVALGATALRTLTDNRSIQAARGYICESTLVPGQKVLPTYHPQAVGYQWDLHWQVIMDLRKALTNSQTPGLWKEDRVLRASVSKHEYLEYLQWLLEKHKGPIALDVETASPGSHIDIVGIADSPKHAVSFEFLHQRNPKFSLDGELEIWQALARVLPTKELIMQNASYDSAVLWLNNGILCKNTIADTMIATHVCWPEVPRNLGFQASICLNVPAWKHLQHDMPPYYNCCDAANTYGIWEVLKIEIEKLGVRHTFDAEMAQLEPSTMLQLQGLHVDNEKRIAMEKDTKEELIALEGQIETDIGRSVNFNSPKQMQQLLYVDMGLPMQFKRRKSITESRKLTTDEEAMKKLARTSGNPVLEKIMKAKKLGKLLSSFIDINVSPESRVHTSYNITGATIQRQKSGQIYDEEDSFKSFGRWSSSASIILPYGSGNLQNIPPAARVFYAAGEGKKYIVGDYIQAEAEVVAYETNDHKLKKMFQDSFGTTKKERERNNWDVHKMKASDMFRVSLSDVTPEQRRVGKTIRHARNYAAGPAVLANKLNVSMKEAKELIQIDKETCPQLLLWHMRIQNELRQTRTLVNLLGRKHRFLGRWPKPGEEGTLFRSAYSYIPQSTVGDLLNDALVRLYHKCGDWLHESIQLHDAIYCIVSEDKVDKAAIAMRKCMLYPLYCNGEEFTIDVDFKVGDSWGELEDYEIRNVKN